MEAGWGLRGILGRDTTITYSLPSPITTIQYHENFPPNTFYLIFYVTMMAIDKKLGENWGRWWQGRINHQITPPLHPFPTNYPLITFVGVGGNTSNMCNNFPRIWFGETSAFSNFKTIQSNVKLLFLGKTHVGLWVHVLCIWALPK